MDVAARLCNPLWRPIIAGGLALTQAVLAASCIRSAGQADVSGCSSARICRKTMTKRTMRFWLPAILLAFSPAVAYADAGILVEGKRKLQDATMT